MTMTSKNEHNDVTKHVYFANGFPPKGLVNIAPPKTVHQGYKLPGRQYVNLDEVSPRLGHPSRTIPPLAKGRGQFCSVKNRPEDNRFKRRPDPFQCHKGAEKTGFSASPVKHSKPKMPIRACHSSEPPTPPPPTAAVYNLKTLARRSVYSTPLTKSAENDFDEDMVKATVELRSKNNKIISDVEREATQSELAGLEEVYHRICNGKMESLYSLLYPSRRDVRSGPVQYIKTSAPLPLRSPRAAQRAMKTTKEKDVSAEAVEANGIEKTTIERRVPVQPSIVDDTVHEQKENSSRPILIPLPYVRPEVGVIAPAKQHKPAYNVPLVYTSRTAKPVLGHALSNTAPAVITFNPMDIPELGRPGAKNGPATAGFVIGAQSKANTGSVAGTGTDHPSTVSSRPTLYEAPSQPEKADLKEIHNPVLENGVTKTVGSEYGDHSIVDGGNDSKTPEIPINKDPVQEGNTALEESASTGNTPQEIVAQGIRLSITTEEGRIGDLEIFNYAKRDIEGEQLAARHMEELEEIGEKKIKEFEELLEEHQHIIEEVKLLEKELENSHHTSTSN